MAALRRLNTLLCHSWNLSPSSFHLHQSSTGSDALVTRPSPRPSLCITPQSALADELLDIRISGLRPGQHVVLQAEVETECKRFKFHSKAIYKADSQGMVMVKTQPSLGGTYEGIEPMGPIWSCRPTADKAHLHPRLKKADSRRPFHYTFRLLDQESAGNGAQASNVTIERRYLADYVKRLEVNYGKAFGYLFLPVQRGSSDPLPVVIELRGVGNGVLEDRASLLASHGFAVFAFDYSRALVVEDKPDIYYFDAQAWLDIFEYVSNHERLDARRVGVFGFCLGSTLALHAASRLDLPIKCLVLTSMVETFCCIVGMKMPDGQLLNPAGTLEEFCELYEMDGYTWIRARPLNEVAIDLEREDIKRDAMSPVENISVPMFLLINGDDQYQVSKERMMLVIDRMQKGGKGHLVQSYFMEGTGHLLDAPYIPIVTKSSLKFPTTPKPLFTMWGGTEKLYSREVERSWHLVLEYFRQQLKPTAVYRRQPRIQLQ